MIGLDSVNVTFEIAAKSVVTYHEVRHSHLESYFSEVGQLRRLIGDDELDSVWSEVDRQFRYFRHEPSLAPLPLGHDVHRSRIDLPFLGLHVRQAQFTRPGLATSAKSCLDQLTQLVESEENPIQDEIGQLIESFGQNDSLAVVVTYSRYVPPVREYYDQTGLGWVDVIDPNALRRERCWDRLIFVGPVSQKFVDCEFVFSAPRAPEIHVVGLPWHWGKWEPQKAFTGGWAGKSGQRNREFRKELPLDELPPVNFQEIEERLLETREPVDDRLDVSNAQVDARLFGIFGGKGVLLEASERKSSMIIDLDASQEKRIFQLSDREIQEGMYIVLRTDSADGYLVPIADQILGSSSLTHRGLQAKWKAALQGLLTRMGSRSLVSLLTKHGSGKANYQNIRNWIAPTSIAPESKDDFRAIAICCHMENQFGELEYAAIAIRKAHIAAGQKVRRQLRAIVGDAHPDTIERQGYQEFEVPSLPGARLTAFRIERRWDEVRSVSVSSLDRVFDLRRS